MVAVLFNPIRLHCVSIRLLPFSPSLLSVGLLLSFLPFGFLFLHLLAHLVLM